jgi:hypothetical protein
MIGCWCDRAFVEKIDRARRSRTRSAFCREAIAEKLRYLGFEVPEQEAASPDRAGKGGRRQGVYPITPHAAQLNEPGPGSTAAGKGPSRKNAASDPKAKFK